MVEEATKENKKMTSKIMKLLLDMDYVKNKIESLELENAKLTTEIDKYESELPLLRTEYGKKFQKVKDKYIVMDEFYRNNIEDWQYR